MFYWGAGDGLGNISRRMVEVAVGKGALHVAGHYDALQAV